MILINIALAQSAGPRSLLSGILAGFDLLQSSITCFRRSRCS
jgi:hypothetical protein